MNAVRITVMPGDGIGPEIVTEALRVLGAVERRFSRKLVLCEEAVGGAAIVRHGVPLLAETLVRARESAAVLFGAVGDPRFDDPAASVRPEQAILGLRQGLGLFANLRPIRAHAALVDAGPLRPERVAGVDLVIVRELTGGLYFGEPQRRWRDDTGRRAVDTLCYSEHEIVRILRVAFALARSRFGRVCSVDKANVLASSRLWRELAGEVAGEFPEVTLEHMLVDSCAMRLVTSPTSFDVIVTENMFGDILSDEAAVLGASLGMVPSASLGLARGDGTAFGLYEPIHGSAPDIAGRDLANPIATIASAAMLLRHSLGWQREARAIERAIGAVLDAGLRTADLAGGGPTVGTAAMGRAIAAAVEAGADEPTDSG